MSKKAKVVGLLVFVLTLLGAVGGSYLFYQFKTKQLITQLLQQFSPVAEISVNNIAVDLQGKVQLDSIQIAPRGFKDVVSIDKIELIAQDAWALLSSGNWFKETLPSSLNVRLSSVVFSLDSDFILGKSSQKSTSSSRSIWGLACAQDANFVALTDKLGLTKIQLDGQVRMESDASQKILRTVINFDAPGMMRGFFELGLSSKVPLNFYERSILSQTEVASMLLSVTDTGFNIKRLKHCAKQEEISEASYPDFFKASVDLQMLDNTDQDSEGLDKSVMAFFKPRTNVVLRLAPKDSLFLPVIFNQRFDIFKVQGLSLNVSGKRASTRYLPLLRGQKIVTDEPVAQASEEVLLADIKEQVIKKVRKKTGPAYRNIPIEELSQFEGKEVRLQTLLGKELDGVLLRVEESKIIMRRRVEQGLVTYPVLKRSIESIKVYL
jgi:hypothetical protein